MTKEEIVHEALEACASMADEQVSYMLAQAASMAAKEAGVNVEPFEELRLQLGDEMVEWALTDHLPSGVRDLADSLGMDDEEVDGHIDMTKAILDAFKSGEIPDAIREIVYEVISRAPATWEEPSS